MELKEKTFLITGSSGQLAREFISCLREKEIPFCAPEEDDLDITDADSIHKRLDDCRPDIILNCAAYNQVDRAEKDPQSAMAVNAQGPERIAVAARERDILLVHFSSDYVFDGEKKEPYIEEDGPNPVNVYGKSKLEGEKAVSSTLEEYVLFRLSWVIGQGRQNFLYKLTQWAREKDYLMIVDDEVSVPTFTRDAAELTLLALENDLRGLYHLTSSGQCSRYDLARVFAEAKKLPVEIRPASVKDFPAEVKRPLFSVLSNRKLSRALDVEIPSWKESLSRFLSAQDGS